MKSFRLCMVCMRSAVGDVRGNTEKILKITDKAVRGGSDFIVFPEMSVTGYSMVSGSLEKINTDSPAVREITAASEGGKCICFGFCDDEGYIVQCIADNGKIAGFYRKTHLGYAESQRMKPGNSLDIIRTSKGNAGIQLCWESHFPEISRTYALKGADIILMPHASGLTGKRREETWKRILPSRAYDNSVYAASCNASGDNGAGVSFGGCGMILDPLGRVIAEDFSGEECEIYADITPEPLEAIRNGDGFRTMKNLYYLEKRRPELYLK